MAFFLPDDYAFGSTPAPAKQPAKKTNIWRKTKTSAKKRVNFMLGFRDLYLFIGANGNLTFFNVCRAIRVDKRFCNETAENNTHT